MPVDLTIEAGVGELLLNRPEKLNSLDAEMISDMHRRLDEAEEAGVRALLIHGAGRGFCAGRDLSDADPIHEDATAIIERDFNPLVKRIYDFAAPTFAAVHGPCLGAGLGVALACDVVYMADDGKIGSPFANLGAVMDSGGHFFIVNRLGRQRALELIYSGRLLSGREAAQWGLVNRSTGRASVMADVRDMAKAVATGPTAAYLASKRLVQQIDEGTLGLAETMAEEAIAQGRASGTADYKEGITAFKEKRPATFIGS